MKRTLTLLLLLAVAVMAAACSGTEDPSDVTEEVVDELDLDTESAPEVASEAAGDVVGAIDEAGCQEAAEALGQLPTAVADVAAGQGDVATIQRQLDVFDDVAASAPDDVAADFEVLNRTFQEVSTTLETVDIDADAPGAEAQQALSEVISAMSEETFTSAASTVSAYFAEGCPS